jgi:hypothetical protein
LLIDYVVDGNGLIEQRKEDRTERQRRFWYRANVPVPGFRQRLFVEIILVDEDPESPAVELVSAHQ